MVYLLIFWLWKDDIKCNYRSQKIIYFPITYLSGLVGSNWRLSKWCHLLSSWSFAISTTKSERSSPLPCRYHSSNKMAPLYSSLSHSTNITILHQMQRWWTYPHDLSLPWLAMILHLYLPLCLLYLQRNVSLQDQAFEYPSSRLVRDLILLLFHFFEPQPSHLLW